MIKLCLVFKIFKKNLNIFKKKLSRNFTKLHACFFKIYWENIRIKIKRFYNILGNFKWFSRKKFEKFK